MAETRGPSSDHEVAFDVAFDIERADVLGSVPHGFFGSAGGAHQFGYGGPGDDEALRKLRSMAASALLPGAPLMAPHQVHSPQVVTVGNKWPDAARDRPVADAVVTTRSDVVLGIVTADCGPVLLADQDAGVIAAAHAGWRGAHDGVLENTIAAMEELGASRDGIAAALGPTIAQSSYEVDSGFRNQFGEDEACFFANAPTREGIERWQFDLPAYILAQLQAAGLHRIAALGLDTYTDGNRYHSYRRAVHQGHPNYGRQISAIALG